MILRRLLSLLLLGMLIVTPRIYGQRGQVNPTTVDVNKMSDEQVRKLISEMERRGMGMEEAVALARARGASQQQIDQLISRIKSLKQGVKTTQALSSAADDMNEDIDVSEKAEFESGEIDDNVFGFQFFNSKNLSFAPDVNVPVSDDYALGNGDEVIINVYGASQQTYNLRVNRNGVLQIPDLGPVYVGGLSFVKATNKIKRLLVSIYSGMQGDKPNTFAEVSLGSLKGIKVNVIGEVFVPGTYTLPATASAFNALYLAGGPNSSGSFRKIDVMRDGKIYHSIDVYKYIVDGDGDENIQLRDQDVLLVRPYINRVSLGGEFKRTGMFEAVDGESVSDLIRFAGGFTQKAYTNRLELYRNNSRTLTFKDVEGQDFDKVLAINGDSLFAGVVAERFENRVSINGAVYREGNYELTPGMKLSHLLERAEGVKEEAFLERGVITRKQKDMSLQTIAFSVKDVLNGVSDIELIREDMVQISSIFDLREERTVNILGEVQFPGVYVYSDNMLLKDLIFQAGGFKENADVSSIEVARRLSYDEAAEINSTLFHTYQFTVDRNLKISDEDADFELKPYDYVYIRQAPGFRPQGTVQISGEVKYAGSYGISKKQERISDLIYRAGGLTPQAYERGASLRRRVVLSDAEYQARVQLAEHDTTLNVEDVKKVDYTIVGINLDQIMLESGSEKDVFVSDGDQLLIPSRYQTVKVSGEILNPVAHTYSKALNLRDYIRKSGGFSTSAKKDKVYVIYANGTTAATRDVFLGYRFPKIEPGCEIVVPSKPQVDRAAQTAKWLGLTSGFASLATSIVAIISLSK